MKRRGLSYESDPLYPAGREARLRAQELPVVPVRPPQPEKSPRRRRPDGSPPRRPDKPMWQAIRKDRARGLPRATILKAYRVSLDEYARAILAGKKA